METINAFKSIIKSHGQHEHIATISKSGKKFPYPGQSGFGMVLWGSHLNHRTMFLAYAYLRGKAYRVAEPTAVFSTEHERRHLIWTVFALLSYHGVEVTYDQVREWMEAPEPTHRLERRLRRMAAGETLRMAKREANLQKIATLRAQKVA